MVLKLIRSLHINTSFKMHIDELCKRLKIKLGFLYTCLSSTNRRQIVQATFIVQATSVIDYGDIIYMLFPVTLLAYGVACRLNLNLRLLSPLPILNIYWSIFIFVLLATVSGNASSCAVRLFP